MEEEDNAIGSPPETPEAMETKLIGLAMRNAEELLQARKAPTTVLVHFLKLGSIRAEIELQKALKERDLLVARTDETRAKTDRGQIAADAIAAFRSYRSSEDADD